MNKIIILFIVLSFHVPCHPQVTFERNGYRPGDKIVRQQLSGMPTETTGESMEWDLRGLDVVAESHLQYAGKNEDSLSNIIALENGNRQSFLLSQKGLTHESTENYTSRMHYDLKEKTLIFPMSCGDSISGLFSGYGYYCDKVFIREFGNYTTKIDGSGKIFLPDGTTLANVLRLTSERSFTIRSYSLDSIREIYGDCIPVYTNDSILFYLKEANGLLHSERRYWYASGYRYPVLETYSLRKGEDNVLQEATWYTSPETQLLLGNDEENVRIRNYDALMKQSENGDNTNGEHEGNPFSYVLQNNEGSQTILITLSLSCQSEVLVTLADVMGVIYKKQVHTCKNAGKLEITLDYRGLKRGKYVIYINVNGKYAAEKFSKK